MPNQEQFIFQDDGSIIPASKMKPEKPKILPASKHKPKYNFEPHSYIGRLVPSRVFIDGQYLNQYLIEYHQESNSVQLIERARDSDMNLNYNSGKVEGWTIFFRFTIDEREPLTIDTIVTLCSGLISSQEFFDIVKNGVLPDYMYVSMPNPHNPINLNLIEFNNNIKVSQSPIERDIEGIIEFKLFSNCSILHVEEWSKFKKYTRELKKTLTLNSNPQSFSRQNQNIGVKNEYNNLSENGLTDNEADILNENTSTEYIQSTPFTYVQHTLPEFEYQRLATYINNTSDLKYNPPDSPTTEKSQHRIPFKNGSNIYFRSDLPLSKLIKELTWYS